MTDQEVLPTAALDHTVDTLLDTLLAALDMEAQEMGVLQDDEAH